jgi:uroporphyrinogen-III synthase
MRLIVTRPEPDATRTAEALIRLGHAAILSPMLDIVPIPATRIPDEPFQAVLVTSGNAVRALQARPVTPFPVATPLLAVGDRTALEARRAGFVAARSAGGALDDLVALASAHLSPADGPLLYAAGDERAGDVAARLSALGFDVETVILYRAEARAKLARVAEAALRERRVDGILFYSPRSASAFAAALRAAGLAPLSDAVACFCISAQTAEPVAPIAKGSVLVAEQPDQIHLFALVERAASSAQTHAR